MYYITLDGKLRLLTKEFETANGLGFSPDEKMLYVIDSTRIMAFDGTPDGGLKNCRFSLICGRNKKEHPTV